jgi:uncharacterized protein YbjQ (UPF0145 family)
VAMMMATMALRIHGYHIVAYKGTAQSETFEELLKSAETLGANAILNTCYDDALDVDTLFHGAAVLIEPIPTDLADNFHTRHYSRFHTTFEESRP